MEQNMEQKEKIDQPSVAFEARLVAAIHAIHTDERAHAQPRAHALEARIIRAIARLEMRRVIFFRIPIFICVIGLLVVADAYAVAGLSYEIMQTHFQEIMYAFFSDVHLALLHWHEYGLLILESLPTMGLIAFFVSVGISIFAVRAFIIYIRQLTHITPSHTYESHRI